MGHRVRRLSVGHGIEAELKLKDADAAARQLQDREQKVEDQVGTGGKPEGNCN